LGRDFRLLYLISIVCQDSSGECFPDFGSIDNVSTEVFGVFTPRYPIISSGALAGITILFLINID
jgi:hypothetical protein